VALTITQAQTVTSEPISGLQSGRTFVPLARARPNPSDLERQNLTNRAEGDNESVADLVQNLKGDDSTLEIIVGRGRLLTLKEPLASTSGETPNVAVGDPTVLDFDLLPNSRMIRLLGKRVGMTDLSIVTASGETYNFEVQVVYDLNLLRAYLKQLFPDASLKVVQMYEHIVIEGEAPSIDQSNQILQSAEAFLTSAQVPRSIQSQTRSGTPTPRPPSSEPDAPANENPEVGSADSGTEGKPTISATLPPPRIINLIRVPGVQQIMLQVRIAELNRTAFRRAGVDWLYRDSSGRTLGSRLGSSSPAASPTGGTTDGFLGLTLGAANTAFAIIPNATVTFALEHLRTNQIVNILAEPTLVAMHGQPASFLAGGEFPVPVPQGGGVAGAGIFTIEYKEFGVFLNFVPYIMQNGAIRLNVAPEVSTIDQTIGITANGFDVPGINTRRANTTVELHQGQTLALAGLLQAELEGATDRLPGLGDLPYLGTFFSNSSHERVEKELIILVTPFLVDAMESPEVGCLPGQEVRDPDDHEFYWLNRIEGRGPNNCFRTTHAWYDNAHSKVQPSNGGIVGPYGFSN
jgi:pilus assembly protein CpaC